MRHYIFIFILVCILSIVFCGMFLYYKLFMAHSNLIKSIEELDVFYKKRWDLIPSLIETVKKYLRDEKNALEGLILLRNGLYENIDFKVKVKNDKEFKVYIERVVNLALEFDELKSSEKFNELKSKLKDVDAEVMESIAEYQTNLQSYNRMIASFPYRTIARICHFKDELSIF